MSHRIGRLGVGDAAVVIAVASPHRAEAFEVCREVIEAIKRELPVWKRQIEADGSTAWKGLGGLNRPWAGRAASAARERRQHVDERVLAEGGVVIDPRSVDQHRAAGQDARRAPGAPRRSAARSSPRLASNRVSVSRPAASSAAAK